MEAVTTIAIERIAAGGDGVGRIDGLACFVPRSAPGDIAQVAYLTQARHARGRVLQLLERSTQRVVPACRHYDGDRCGGCQLQHLSAAAQRDARVQLVQDTLARIGKRAVERPEIVSGVEWAYRGRLTLTLLPRGRSWIGGLHPHDDALRVFEMEECPITHPSLVQTWHAISPIAHGLPAAPRLRLGLRLTGALSVNGEVSPDVAVVVQGGKMWEHAAEWGARLLRTATLVQSVWWIADGATASAVALRSDGASSAPPDATLLHGALDDEDLPEAGTAPLAQDALAFAQVNTTVAAALRGFVVEQVQRFAPTRVIDAYAGTGELSQQLAVAGIQVTAIESDEAGSRAARRRFDALAPAILARTRLVRALVEHALADWLPADVVVLNPPRRGVDLRVTQLLEAAAARGVQAIVYVSCDPATLARDVARLPAWRITALQCFDMFPQTAHVETVCVLIPEEK